MLMPVLLAACSLEQVQLGQWYRIITPATGSCPMQEWRFVVDPSRHIGGHVNRINDGRIATLDGTLAPDDTYRMTATAVNGGATAEVTGQFRRVLTIIAIKGDALGRECNGQTIRMRYINYYGYSGGGGGGS